MLAIKEIKKIKNKKITINIPESFPSDQAEVIVLPYSVKLKGIRERQRASLLSAPVISDAEVKNLKDVREYLNQWTIKGF